MSASKQVWRPIKSYRGIDSLTHVDVWMEVHASPMSMGWGDSFRVTDCWRKDGKWYHFYPAGVPAELVTDYITHWMPIPDAPKRKAVQP